MGRGGQCLHPRGTHRGLNPGPPLPFPRLGDRSSSPVFWVVRATVCTQGEALGFEEEALGIEPKTSSPISQAGRPPFNSRYIVKEGHRMHPRRGTEDWTQYLISHFSSWEATLRLPFHGLGGPSYAPKERHRGLKPIPHLPFPGLGGYPASPVSWVGKTTYAPNGEAPRGGTTDWTQYLNSHFPAWEATLHLTFPCLGGTGDWTQDFMSHFTRYPSSPVSWARRAVICTQGEAPCVCVCVCALFSFSFSFT
jgi:hypothetical protein